MAKTVKVTMPWIREVEESDDIELERIKIVQSDIPGKIEIYLLDNNNEIIEGGTFDLNDFMNHLLEFYNKNY